MKILVIGLDGAAPEILLHDERLTTVEASQALSAAGRDQRAQRSLVDSAAATVLLESWLASS